jgi:hypothetical protein
MRSPGRDRRAGRAHRAGSTGPRSGPRRGPHGPRPGAGASRQGAGGDGPHGAADGGPRERGRGTRPAAAGGPGRRQGTVGGNGSRAAPWHQDSPRSAPRPRASFVTLGSWIFSRFRFRERFGPLKSAADGRVWCHNFAKPERNEVVAPHVVHVPTRQPISDGRRDRGAVVPQLRQIRAKRSFVTTRSSASSACLVPCPLQTKP